MRFICVCECVCLLAFLLVCISTYIVELFSLSIYSYVHLFMIQILLKQVVFLVKHVFLLFDLVAILRFIFAFLAGRDSSTKRKSGKKSPKSRSRSNSGLVEKVETEPVVVQVEEPVMPFTG